MPKGVYIRSEETRRKMSIASTGRKMPQSMKDKISKIHKGKTISLKQRKQHSLFMKQHPPSKEVLQNLIQRKEKHWNWKGGISLTKEYRAKYSLLSHRKRRNIKLKVKGLHTEEEWENLKKEYKNLCANCHQKRPLSRDHIVPINKGGHDSIDNIQPLCISCNSKKHTKIIKYEKKF